MKGVIADFIRSMLGGPIISASDIVYSDPPTLSDLEDNGLVTKDMLLGSMPIAPTDQIGTVITGGVTANPITVNYGAMVNPTLIFRNADGSNYGGAVNNVDNGTEIVLTGDDDGAGHFADSFNFIIKP
jgi:hypothetical protein